ncbi:MAG: 3-oxoacyl-ACP reductase FabG [Gammaproteobacteria bacterium]|nr:3-oxoacyl-ACP reductase FabG [Gammaproteobacteria bacterium]
MLLQNEVALITGASRGIGRAIALELGRQGACIVGTATSSEGAENIEKGLKENGTNGIGRVLNVTQADSIDALLAEMGKTVGMPTILINNAGITRDGLLLRMSEADWDAIFDTNLKSVYRLTKACLRSMTKARKGRIISVTSVVAAIGNAGQTNYAAAKAGIIGFTRSLAREVGSRNVTVNAVAPGFVDTDMARALPEASRQALIGQIPLGRLGLAEEIAHAVAFLASPQAAYITGTTLHVNGGMYMG